MSSLRAVPEVVYALVFVTAVGLGPFPGVLALVVHNAGVMGKLWSEAMEEVDPGPVDALRTSGASRGQLILHAVLPAVLPQSLGLLLYRLDVNVRASLVLGLVGAGGVGFLIDQSVNLFRFDQMVSYIALVLVMVIAVDQLSAAVRRRVTNTN
jgi:phosphonate transport system permease protein